MGQNALYEITNGYTGESYVRVYVWAESYEDALRLGRLAFYEANERRIQQVGSRHAYPSNYWERLEANCLFNAEAESFASVPSDCGFEMGPNREE